MNLILQRSSHLFQSARHEQSNSGNWLARRTKKKQHAIRRRCLGLPSRLGPCASVMRSSEAAADLPTSCPLKSNLSLDQCASVCGKRCSVAETLELSGPLTQCTLSDPPASDGVNHERVVSVLNTRASVSHGAAHLLRQNCANHLTWR